MSEPEVLVLRPLRTAAHKALAVPVGLLLVGLLTRSPVLTLVTTMWSAATLVGVLLSRVVLDGTGVSVRPGLRRRRASWPDVQEVFVEGAGLRRRTVVLATATRRVRLPAPPGFFRTDEARLALQLALVDSWWRRHRGRRWKRARPAARRPTPR